MAGFAAVTLIGALLAQTPSFGLEPRPPVADGVPVRVIDAASGKPVPDALVVSVDELEFTLCEEDDDGMPIDAAALLRRLGKAYVTGSDGCTRIAPPAEPRSLFAWHGRDFGRTTLEVWDRAEQVIALAPRELVVEVVDAAGRPRPGIPLLLGECALQPESPGVWRGVTGADGRVSIPALDLEQSVHRTCGRRALIMLECMAPGIAVRPIDAPILEPVRFVLPEFGELRIELEDSEGKPFAKRLKPGETTTLRIVGAALGEPRGLERQRASENWRWRSLTSNDGTFHLPNVALGMRLSLDVRSSSHEFEEIPILGPTKAGEVKRVVIRAAQEHEESGEESPPGMKIGLDRIEEPAEEPTEDDAGGRPDKRSSIEVSVLVDEPIPACLMRARLNDNRSAYDFDISPWIDVNGHATIRHVPAGSSWSVAINVSGFNLGRSDIVVREIEPIEIEARQHLRDPRLLQIDLRGKLRRHRLEIADAEGRPLAGRIHFMNRENGALDEAVDFENGRHEFLTAANDDRRAVVVVERFRPAVLDSLSDLDSAVHHVTMKRGIPIRVVLDPKFALPVDPRVTLYVGVPELPRNGADSDDPRGGDVGRTLEVLPGGFAQFELPEPGNHRVWFTLCRADRVPSADGGGGATDDGGSEYHWCGALEPTIEVEDRAVEQTFVVTPDPEGLAAALVCLKEDE